MHPRLLTTPFYTLRTFGVLLAAAYLAAYWWMMREGRRQRLDVDALGSLGVWAIVGAIVGARVLMIVRTLPDYIAAPASSCRRRCSLPRGRFLRRVHRRADHVGDLFSPHPAAAVLAGRRRVRAGHRTRPGHWPDRLPDGRRRLRTADHDAVGQSPSPTPTPRPSAARRSACRFIRCSSTSRSSA